MHCASFSSAQCACLTFVNESCDGQTLVATRVVASGMRGAVYLFSDSYCPIERPCCGVQLSLSASLAYVVLLARPFTCGRSNLYSKSKKAVL